MLKTIISSPYLNLLSGLVLMTTAGIEIFDTFNTAGIGSHHGIFVFGIIQALRSFPEIFHALEEFEHAEENV